MGLKFTFHAGSDITGLPKYKKSSLPIGDLRRCSGGKARVKQQLCREDG
jgi:hypothetical protein